MPQTKTSTSTLPPVTRAINGLQRRVRRWHKLHPEVDASLAIVSECGFEPEPGYLHCGVLRSRVTRNGQVDTDETGLFYYAPNPQWWGAVYEEYVDYVHSSELYREDYGMIQGAFLAITGMSDLELARALKTKPAIVSSWYTGEGVLMPVWAVRSIMTACLHDDDEDCTPLRRLR